MGQAASLSAQLRTVIRHRNLNAIRRVVREYQHEGRPVPLRQALQIVAIIDEVAPEKFEAAAVRWIARLAAEGKGVTLEQLSTAIVSLDELDGPEGQVVTDLIGLLRRAHVA